MFLLHTEAYSTISSTTFPLSIFSSLIVYLSMFSIPFYFHSSFGKERHVLTAYHHTISIRQSKFYNRCGSPPNSFLDRYQSVQFLITNCQCVLFSLDHLLEHYRPMLCASLHTHPCYHTFWFKFSKHLTVQPAFPECAESAYISVNPVSVPLRKVNMFFIIILLLHMGSHFLLGS